MSYTIYESAPWSCLVCTQGVESRVHKIDMSHIIWLQQKSDCAAPHSTIVDPSKEPSVTEIYFQSWVGALVGNCCPPDIQLDVNFVWQFFLHTSAII